MAEVTWRATLIGALMLFLIGLVVATCLNYTQACLRSIKVGLNGEYDCEFEKQIFKKKTCNDTGEISLQDCIFVFVSFTNQKTDITTENIKLSYSYNPNDTYNGGDEFGECSAQYCGNHRFTDINGNHKDIPKLVQRVTEANVSRNGTIKCFINPNRPQTGAYIELNDIVDKPEDRMFRLYEAWIILIAPFIVLLGIVLSILILFLRGDLSASPIQKPHETFVPPGFQNVSASTSASAQGSIKSTKKADSQPVHV